MSQRMFHFSKLLIAAAVLTGCSAPKYTIDDGRQVNEELLKNIRTYGAGELALRPAIYRTAQHW
jgi:hypothetical protein